jgi:hypothetical protein
MNLGPITAGDIVHCDVKGRTFHALVDGPADDFGLPVSPINRGTSYRTVSARQVTAHFRKMGRKRPVKK